MNKNPKILKLIDEEWIVSNFNVDGNVDKEFVGEILNVYVTDIPIMIKELETAFENKDAAILKFYAHKLSGNLLNLGCESLVELCRSIETSIKKNDFNPEISLLIFELKKSITRLVIELFELKVKYPVSRNNQ